MIDAPMDVEAAAAAAMEALQPPPVPPSTVFPEVEVTAQKCNSKYLFPFLDTFGVASIHEE